MQLRYVIGRMVPDLTRQEPINVGVILQSDQWVDCRFIERVPKDWGLEEDIVHDVAIRLNDVWKARLASPTEILYLPETHEHREVAHTDKAFLTWIQQTYTRHLQFTEMREAEIDGKDTFDFDTFLQRLYGIFVVPKPRPRKPPARSRLHSKIKEGFKQLELPVGAVRERDVVVGTFPWHVDFVYSNGNGNRHEVAIGVLDLELAKFIDKAKDLMAIWTDVRTTRGEEVERISVVGGDITIGDHNRAFQMIKRYSDDVYVFERQRETFLERVASDLLPLNSFRRRGIPPSTHTDK